MLPPAPGFGSSELITSMDFCPEKNILAASTNAGYIYMWKYGSTRPTEEDWQVLPRVHIGPTVRALTWGGANRSS